MAREAAALGVRERPVVRIDPGDQIARDEVSQSPIAAEFEYMLPWYFVNAFGITRINSLTPAA